MTVNKKYFKNIFYRVLVCIYFVYLYSGFYQELLSIYFLLCDHQSENNMNHLHCHIYLRDDDYLREIRAGGSRADTAISCLYLKHRKRIHSYLRTLISKQGAFKGVPDDLVHDSFIIMIEKIQQDAAAVRSLAGYCIGIAKWLFLNQLKKDERTVLVGDAEEKYGYDSEFQHSIVHDHEEGKMEAAFLKLGPRCREILMLWINQYTMLEISGIMHLSNPSMARKIKYECFKKLKEIVNSGNI